MLPKISVCLVVFIVLQVVVAPPVDQKKPEKDDKKDKPDELDDFGLEYGRYLQQVVQALEEDKEFAKKLENISAEEIRSGHIAKELEFVKHNVRSKLDELKRIEMDRLRKLLQEQMERTELGLYRDEDGHLLNSPDGRRWRTIPNHRSGLEGLNRKGVKIPKHLDVENPHSFEIDDLKKLILTATNDLEELDKQRREEFKKYELEKEAKYRESLKNMTEEEKKKTEEHHQELINKHKDHPSLHHPGSKPQLEQVWEDQDHMPKEEFNPKTFFAFHDINGDGFLDVEEVEAILLPEVKKIYNPNNEEDDPAEMEEEFHRMREHIFNETDKNKDHLISLDEFLKMTEQQEFQRDEGWKGLDEQSVYSEAELQEYMRQRQMEMQGYQQYPYADQRAYYDVNAPQHGLPPQINYQVPPQSGYPHGQQYGVPPHNQVPAGQPQYHQGAPQMQFHNEHPQQFQGQPMNQAGYPQQPYHQQNPQGMQQQHQVPPGHPQQVHPNQQQFQANQHQPQFQSNQQQVQNQMNQQQQVQNQMNQQQQVQNQMNQQQQVQNQMNQQQPPNFAQGNQQFVSVPPQQELEQKQPVDKSNSINRIPDNEIKQSVPQESVPQASAQQIPVNKS